MAKNILSGGGDSKIGQLGAILGGVISQATTKDDDATVLADNGFALTDANTIKKPSCLDSERITVSINPVASPDNDGSSPNKRPNMVSPFDCSIEIDKLIKLREGIDSGAIDMDRHIREGLSR